MDNKGFEDLDKVPEQKTKQQLAEELNSHNNNNNSKGGDGIDPEIKRKNKQG
jgi:hypothetical protein